MEPYQLNNGISLVEALLALAVFSLLVVGVGGSLVYSQETNTATGNRAQALLLAEEGIEAVRSIRDRDFDLLSSGTYGLTVVGSQWEFSGTFDETDIFERSTIITEIDGDEVEVESKVNWQQTRQRSGEVILTTRLSDWQREVSQQPDCTGPPAERPEECVQQEEEPLDNPGNGNN